MIKSFPTQPITVQELFDFLNGEISRGHGNKHIFISKDDEGNSFHALFYALTTNPEVIKNVADLLQGIDIEEFPEDLDNIVLLG